MQNAITLNKPDSGLVHRTVQTTLCALTGALAASTTHLVTFLPTISKLGGGVFGAVSSLSAAIIDYSIKKIFGNSLPKVVVFAANFFASILIGSLAAKIVGASISLTTGFLLTAGMFAINKIMTSIYHTNHPSRRNYDESDSSDSTYETEVDDSFESESPEESELEIAYDTDVGLEKAPDDQSDRFKAVDYD